MGSNIEIEVTDENLEAYNAECRKAAVAFLDACSMHPTPEAVSQLAEAFLPCLQIICERGYDPDGANWQAMGWRGLLSEIGKRWGRIKFNGWKRGQYDRNNAVDAINYLGYYIRRAHSGSEWGEMGNPI